MAEPIRATRGYFEERSRQEGNSPLGQAIRRWLANPNDGEAADIIEANPLEVGLTRTRCVATCCWHAWRICSAPRKTASSLPSVSILMNETAGA